MNYTQSLEYLYGLPTFHLNGAEAYKPGLDNISLLLEYLGNPHLMFPSVHVAGTNGKGSTAHLIAAALQKAGYRVGLYTSPHLVDFTERIRVKGKPISHGQVMAFVEQYRDIIDDVRPSFFEAATALAFDYFARKRVDVAVVEVGLGGLLDATNFLNPLVSVITSIGFDHEELLGDTLEKIAAQKAGIIKPSTPVVVGEQSPVLIDVFRAKAEQVGAPLYLTSALPEPVAEAERSWHIDCQLRGDYQQQNIRTALLSLYVLSCEHGLKGFSEEIVAGAFASVCDITGLQGRWQVLADEPLVICDIGHNSHGLKYVFSQLTRVHKERVSQWMCQPFDGSEPKAQPRMRVVFGMVNDKDINEVIDLLPRHSADFYLTQAKTPRAIPAEELKKKFLSAGLQAEAYPAVNLAVRAALAEADKRDVVLLTGSNYVVGEALAWWHRYRK